MIQDNLNKIKHMVLNWYIHDGECNCTISDEGIEEFETLINTISKEIQTMKNCQNCRHDHDNLEEGENWLLCCDCGDPESGINNNWTPKEDRI